MDRVKDIWNYHAPYYSKCYSNCFMHFYFLYLTCASLGCIVSTLT